MVSVQKFAVDTIIICLLEFVHFPLSISYYDDIILVQEDF